MGDSSVTLQLRYLQTLREIGGSQNSTIVFPIPMDVVGPMMEAIGRGQTGRAADNNEAREAARASGEAVLATPASNGLGLDAGTHHELVQGDQADLNTNLGQGDQAGLSAALGQGDQAGTKAEPEPESVPASRPSED